MTEKRFTCNFCRDSIYDCRGEQVAGHHPGTGLVWFESATQLQIRRCADAENHICLTCLKALRGMSAGELATWQVK